MCNNNDNSDDNNDYRATGDKVYDDGDIAMDGNNDGEGNSATMTMTTLRRDATTRTMLNDVNGQRT